MAKVNDFPPADWLDGAPMDPTATPTEPLPPRDGIPILPSGIGSCGIIVGPTGGGRSSFAEVLIYDAAQAGLRCAYLGQEVTRVEFDARAAVIARSRGDALDEARLTQLAKNARYLELSSVIVQARGDPARWIKDVVARYDILVVDPLSAVASSLDLDFDNRNTEFIRFYDLLVQPLVDRGEGVLLIDNVGHAIEAGKRPKGVSAKQDKPDLTFSCSSSPAGLRVTAGKVRPVRASHRRGDTWLFAKDTQRIERAEHVKDSPRPAFRPRNVMEKLSRAIEANGGLSKSQLRTAVSAKADVVDLALGLLVSEGYVEVHAGKRKAQLHHHIKPYREATESTESPPSLDQVSDRVAATESDRVHDRYVVPGGSGLGLRAGGPGLNGVTESLFADEAPKPENAITAGEGLRS